MKSSFYNEIVPTKWTTIGPAKETPFPKLGGVED